MIRFLEIDEVIQYLKEQSKTVDLKPKRKIYFEKFDTVNKVSKLGTTYYAMTEAYEVYYNGVELKYWDNYGSSKKFTKEVLNQAVFVLEDENKFNRRVDFSAEIDELLNLR